MLKTCYIGGMSATTEKLLEEIARTEHALAECRVIGNDGGVERLTIVLKALHEQLHKANDALNEGVLKG